VNADETDVDCGGADCAPCAMYRHCNGDADCTTGVCNLALATCVTPQCYDGALDGNESDVDCGGSCAPCALGGACVIDQDCASQACDGVSMQCVADQCNDHRTDGQEGDVDCGAPCTPCAIGQGCNSGFDCASMLCVNRLCHVPYCIDGVQDGNETDVDCGGGPCTPCALGQKCNVYYDCQSQACDAVTRICISDHCLDHTIDGDETDTDCGGPTCAARCGKYDWCHGTSDCVLGLTCSGGVCE
jgi:hypothetical protein